MGEAFALANTKGALRGFGPTARALALLNVPVGERVGELTDASLYVNVRNTGAPPAGVVRVDLVARLGAHEQPVAAALLTPGYAGLAIVATGIPCDSFVLYAGATDPLLEMSAGIIARPCCGGAGVTVPAELQEWPDPTVVPIVDALLDPPLSPLGVT